MGVDWLFCNLWNLINKQDKKGRKKNWENCFIFVDNCRLQTWRSCRVWRSKSTRLTSLCQRKSAESKEQRLEKMLDLKCFKFFNLLYFSLTMISTRWSVRRISMWSWWMIFRLKLRSIFNPILLSGPRWRPLRSIFPQNSRFFRFFFQLLFVEDSSVMVGEIHFWFPYWSSVRLFYWNNLDENKFSQK